MTTRVLLVELAHPPGAAEYTVHDRLVRSSAGAPDPVVALTLSSRPGAARRVGGSPAPGRGTRGLRRMLVFGRSCGLIWRSTLRARAFKPTLVYSSQQTFDVAVAAVLGRLCAAPRIVHLHYAYGPWLGRLATRLTKSATHVVAVSEFCRQTALLRGLDPARVSTVANGWGPALATAGATTLRRSDLGIGEDDPLVAVVGRLDLAKGHDLLLRALPAVVRDVPRVRVLVCGESRHSPGWDAQLQAMSQTLGLGEHVRWLGQRSDISQLLPLCDVFCLPTEMEPFGLVFLEAMAAQLPVVALRSGAVPEVVVDGGTGLLSYPGDVEALAGNLTRLLLDPGLAARLGRAGRERLASQFDGADAARRWRVVLRSVAAGIGAGTGSSRRIPHRRGGARS